MLLTGRTALVVLLAACGPASTTDDLTDDTVENRPPDAPDAVLAPASPRTADDLSVSLLSPPSDPDGDTVTVRVQWLRDNAPQAALADALTVDADATARGQTWTALVSAVDAFGAESERVTLTAVIGNTPPTVSLSTSPAAPSSVDPVALLVTAFDADGESVDVDVTWRLDGNPAPTWDGFETIPESQTERGQRWEARAVATDGTDAGEPAVLEVVIGDGPPTVTSVRVSGNPQEGGTLTATASATDPEGDAVSFEVVWIVNGVRLSGPTGVSIDGAWFDREDVLQAEVTAVSAQGGRSAPALSEEVTILNTAPTLVGASVSPASGNETTVFTCVAEGLADADPADLPITAVSWTVDGSAAGGAATLTGAAFARGQVIACRLTPLDGTAAGVHRASPGVTIGNAPPTVASASVAPSSPTREDTLVATAGPTADADGDTVQLRYAWRVNGAPVAATTSSLASPAFARGDRVQVEISGFDGRDPGASILSAGVTIGNAPPRIRGLAWSPTFPNAFADLTVVPDLFDADGDVLVPHFVWTVNGAPAGSDAATLARTAFVRGNTVAVTVSVADGFGGSASQQASTVIGNAPPGAPTVTLEPVEPESGDDLLCELAALATDPDGDAVTHSYRWRVDGVVFSGATPVSGGSVVSYVDTRPGEVWTCAGLASDGSITTEGPAQSVEVSAVACGASAEDDGLGNCQCLPGFDGCDASEVNCCDVAPSAVDITVVRATIAAKKPNGNDWDDVPLFWDPDAYVEVRSNNVLRGTTSTFDDSVAPSWNYKIDGVPLPEGANVRFSLFDEDTVLDDTIGSFTVSYADVIDALDRGEVTLRGTSVITLVVRIDTP